MPCVLHSLFCFSPSMQVAGAELDDNVLLVRISRRLDVVRVRPAPPPRPLLEYCHVCEACPFQLLAREQQTFTRSNTPCAARVNELAA